MATKVKYVKPEHQEILSQYIPKENKDEGISLVFSEDAQQKLQELGVEDGDTVDYNFGGEPDVWLDTVTRVDHCLLTSVAEDND